MGGDRKLLRTGGGGTVTEDLEGVAGRCGRPCLPALFNVRLGEAALKGWPTSRAGHVRL